MGRFALKLQRASGADIGGGGVPSAPANVIASPGDAKITFSWTTVSGATDYDVEYRTSPSGSWQNWPYSGTVTHTIVTGLVNGTAYDLRVRAGNGAGVSSWSAIVSGVTPVATPATGGGLPTILDATLVNRSNTNTAYAYVIGLDPGDGQWMLVTADGQSTYKPPLPPANGTPLPQDCAIPLNAIGAAGKQIKIPRMISGRIFFSYDQKLQFFTNIGGGFVMPSQLDPADPNIDIQWTFCEFTLNNVELYGNISFVDMLSIPVAFKLEVSDGTGTQYVEGLPHTAMTTVGNRLMAQKLVDGTDWDKCLYYNSGSQLVRILSPNSAKQIYPTAFNGYLEPYVDQVWAKYTNEDLIVDTNRVEWGIKTGRVINNVLDFGGGITFAKPSTGAIWSCSIPPFTTGNDEQGNITARLTAAFNRTTLLINSNQPEGENPATYYTHPITNHYSRIVHEEVYGNLGYAFPYDDVHPSGGISYEGRIQSSNPSHWTLTVGQV